MPNPLVGKHVVLGVTGSIACHKAVDLASKLAQSGAGVDVVMTENASRFASPLAFQSITHQPVITNIFEPSSTESISHISIAERADILVVAPATANTIAKIALGIADDALTTTVLATSAPIIVCPAMDGHMYENQVTQQHIKTLMTRGVRVVGPVQGRLASGLTGTGRMEEISRIIGHIKLAIGQSGDLKGQKLVVSAGGTQEAIDPVRFISNRSSGKMGYAIAEASRDRGATTIIVAAPNELDAPVGTTVVDVVSSSEMLQSLTEECRDANILIMSAAVSDWKPDIKSSRKIKKVDSEHININLVNTPDIVAEISHEGLIKVGFAAETEDLMKNAQAKLGPKGLHLIVANDVTSANSGFGSDTNEVVIINREGDAEELGLMSKYDVANHILDRVVNLLE